MWSRQQRQATAGAAAEPTAVRTVSWAPVAEARLYFSRADLIATRQEVLRAFLALAALGLLLSVAVGFVVSRRVTRPVEALTEAARRIAGGELEVRVEERATGELKALVQTFASGHTAAPSRLARRLATHRGVRSVHLFVPPLLWKWSRSSSVVTERHVRGLQASRPRLEHYEG